MAGSALQRSADNRKDALVKSCRLLHLPIADFGARRVRREHENHRVGLADQVAEASFPVLATGDAVAIDETLKAVSIERRIELVGEVQVVAAVGNEDAKLPFVGRGRPARLLRAIPAGSDEAGPDASCARSAIAPLRCVQINDKTPNLTAGPVQAL